MNATPPQTRPHTRRPFPSQTPPRTRPHTRPPAHATLLACSRVDTPLGPLLLAATAQGLAGAWFDGQAHHPGELQAPEDASHPVLRATARCFTLYWTLGAEAAAEAIEQLPLDPPGTDFQQAVWQQLRSIRPGQTTHYGAIARALGRPQAARAVGAAVGRNPLSVLVPCHRVLGRDGSLTGYAGGLQRKRALLAHETDLRGVGAGTGPAAAQATTDLFDRPANTR